MRRRTLLVATGAVVASPAIVHAQAWPAQPVRLVVAFPPGGPTDVYGRLFGERLGRALGQPVVIENKAGAAGIIGSAGVARAKADGYTLLAATNTTLTINPWLFKNLRYDATKSFSPIALVAVAPSVIVVNPKIPAANLAELVKLGKAKPGSLSYASYGNGSSAHLAGEMLRARSGMDVLHVPYKGGSQVTAALMGGEIPFMFDSLPSPLGQIRGGRLRALAVTSAQRAPAAPEVPTLRESGVNIEAIIWLGLGGPAKLPSDVVAKIFDAMKQVAVDADLQKRMSDMGAEAVVSRSPQEFREFMLRERERWGKVISDAKITVQ